MKLPVLAAEHRVITLDLPGFGHSPMPAGEISISGYARTLDALCDAMKKLLAFEDGGEFAAHLVQEHERFGLLRMGEEKTLGHRVGITQKGECIES